MPSRTWIGWYGKLPFLGDFTRSGLSPRFIAAWDGWMQDLFCAGRLALGARWQACYLTAPIWRFALPGGVCGPEPVAGIVMPSVDRVGRMFPLCLVFETPLCSTFVLSALAPVFEGLEQAALDALEDGATLTWLENTLAGVSGQISVLETPGLLSDFASVPGDPEARLPARSAASEPFSYWTSTHEGRTRQITAARMPSGPELANAFFDKDAPVWSTTDQILQRYRNDAIRKC
ncbi:type VI secretion system-associated protein TagF [Roseibium sp. RKSG952]|uniref:type VI secretion system-associated protein TagF n=1 Tax=Roseibium sp. RKSG952 TaxID=2529384 RepID=UPI0012BB7B80|nr:type VI secretion system-associated protein TagF [Roseibium sp. RKSG952]MTH98023.1 type VI secretion system-associated protein TagF [Roseibium sp. RKSG952]